MWTQNSRPTLYGQWLAWQLTIDHSIGLAKAEKKKSNYLLMVNITNKCTKEALEEARKVRPDRAL